MPRLSGILTDHAQGTFVLCHDGSIEGHLPTYQAAYDALNSFAEQALTRPSADETDPFWPLQTGDQAGDPITEEATNALFKRAFAPSFRFFYQVTYQRRYGTWLATFTWKGTPIELCFNAPDIWRVSMVDRCDSIPFLHAASWPVLLGRLNQALDRLACS